MPFISHFDVMSTSYIVCQVLLLCGYTAVSCSVTEKSISLADPAKVINKVAYLSVCLFKDILIRLVKLQEINLFLSKTYNVLFDIFSVQHM